MSDELGLVIGSSAASPESLAETAKLAEGAGFNELWMAEDFFLTGGISGANIALSASQRIRVGLGIVSALVRHPALLAMEIATTARAYPGRFLPGIGLGVPAWMRQMGLLPTSPLSAVRECVTAVRRLLEGDELTIAGPTFRFDRVKLSYPQKEEIPIHLGVVGPKMLELSGEVANGSILSVGAGANYVRWARERIDVGRERAGRSDSHRITAFAIYSVNRDADVAKAIAREALGFYKAVGGRTALTDVEGISDDLEAMIAKGGADAVSAEMPETWIEELTVSGSPDEVAEKIIRLREAGADAVGLFPAPGNEISDVIDLTGREVLPRL